MLSEDRKEEGLALGMSLADNVTLSSLRGLARAGVVSPARQRASSRRWVESLDIRCRRVDQSVGSLSGGNQQKVALARLLQHDVDILLLDEPTRGIDVASKARIYQCMDELVAGKPPRAVLMVSSYLPELMGVCDRIAVMCRGRLSPARPVSEWNEHSLMLAATGKEESD
jgi:ribose transport system ATP-binding protein